MNLKQKIYQYFRRHRTIFLSVRGYRGRGNMIFRCPHCHDYNKLNRSYLNRDYAELMHSFEWGVLQCCPCGDDCDADCNEDDDWDFENYEEEDD